MKKLIKWLIDENGQGITEAALLIILIAFAVIFILMVLGPKMVAYYENISDKIPARDHS